MVASVAWARWKGPFLNGAIFPVRVRGAMSIRSPVYLKLQNSTSDVYMVLEPDVTAKIPGPRKFSLGTGDEINSIARFLCIVPIFIVG